MDRNHQACKFPTVEKSQQVWCDECRKWTDPEQKQTPSRTIRFQSHENGGILITEREVIGLKHGARSSRRVWNEQRVVIEADDFPKLIKAMQEATPVSADSRVSIHSL